MRRMTSYERAYRQILERSSNQYLQIVKQDSLSVSGSFTCHTRRTLTTKGLQLGVLRLTFIVSSVLTAL